MARHTLSLALLTVVSSVAAQTSITPLVDHHYAYPSQIPYQVDPVAVDRGPQSGYNICNSTTETQTSLCQTSFLNSIDDFCLWAPPTANSTIADTEGETVAWCTKGGHGTRVMPAGTLTGVQILKAPGYIEVVGTINQANIGMQADDGGGELDPHGADLRGNPLGGLVYSNAFPSNGGNNNSYQQVIEWHNYMGSSVFCFKACDPAVADSTKYCNNIFDRIGCNMVAPAAYTEGEFTVCDSDNQDPPGVYTDSAGAIQTFTQPPESLGPITSFPYTATIPKSSNCVTYTSSLLYASAPVLSGANPTATPSGSGSGTGSPTPSATGTGKVTSTGSGSVKTTAKATGSQSVSGSTPSSTSNAASSMRGSSTAGAGLFVAIAMSLMAGMGAIVVAL